MIARSLRQDNSVIIDLMERAFAKQMKYANQIGAKKVVVQGRQHVRQIGIMKSIGARSKQIFTMYIITVIVFGLLSLLIAVPLGGLAAYGFASYLAGPRWAWARRLWRSSGSRKRTCP